MNANRTLKPMGDTLMRVSRILIFIVIVCGYTLCAQAGQTGARQNLGSVPADPNAPAVSASQQKASTIPQDTAASDADLKKAQRDELDAERKYYEAETQKTTAKPTAWDRILPLITPVGAVLAVFVTFLSFSFNYRSTLFNQQDMQFFEALKRFGDKDSPAVRAGAAGLLAELGARSRPLGRTGTRPFLRTSLDQLTVGLLLEENTVVLEAIRAALLKLMELEARTSLLELQRQNQSLQKELALALANFMAAESPEKDAAITDEVWQLAAAVSGFRPLILQTLVQRIENVWALGQTRFLRSLEDSRLRQRRGTADNASVSETLRRVAVRQRSNVPVLSEAILRFHSGSRITGVFLCGFNFRFETARQVQINSSQLQDTDGYEGLLDGQLNFCDFQGANLDMASLEGTALVGSGFEGTKLSHVNLKNADLRGTRLAGATLYDCKLDGAKLYGAKIDETTNFSETNWWAADFTSEGGLDGVLLTDLHDRVLRLKNKYDMQSMFGDEADLTNWLNKAHPSVRDFVTARQKEQSETALVPDPAPPSS